MTNSKSTVTECKIYAISPGGVGFCTLYAVGYNHNKPVVIKLLCAGDRLPITPELIQELQLETGGN